MLRSAFHALVIFLILHESSGLPALEVETRGLENEKVWEAILYAYIVDPDEPSYLARGDHIFEVNTDESIAISSNSDMVMEIEYSDSTHTASQNLAISMSVGVEYGAFAAAASMEVSKTSDKSIKTVRMDSTTKAIRYEVASKGGFRTFPERYLTDNFKESVRALTVEQIEQRIGSFYATRLDLGGEIRKSYIMQAKEEDTAQSVKAELEASFGSGLLGVSAEASVGVSSRVSDSKAQMNVEWSAKGGDTTVWLGKEFTDSGDTSVASIQREWAETMNDDNLYPFNFELGLMWDLVKAVDQQKGEEFQRYLQKKWENNKSQFLPSRFFEGSNKWRSDHRCGPRYPLSDGSKAECNPLGIFPCCSTAGWCGKTPAHCTCNGCIWYKPKPQGPPVPTDKHSWSGWSSTNMRGSVKSALCPPKHIVVGLQWREQNGYGLIDLHMDCGYGSVTSLTGNSRGGTNILKTCKDLDHYGFHAVQGRDQWGYGLINTQMLCNGNRDWTVSNRNMRGGWNKLSECPQGTAITGFEVRDQWGYGLVNFRYRCSEMRH